MTLKDARNLRIGERVKARNGNEFEVCGLNEFVPATGGNTIIYIRCKTETGSMMKFSHKELIIIKTPKKCEGCEWYKDGVMDCTPNECDKKL